MSTPTAVDPSDTNLIHLLHELWGSLSRRRHLQLVVLLLVMLASSAAEVVSLAAVLPFLAVLANPDELWNQPVVHHWALKLEITSPEALLLPITITFVMAALAAGAIRLLNLWLNGMLAAAIGSDLSCDTYQRTLYQPYEVHLARNSSELITSISTDVNRVIYQMLTPLLLLLSSALIAVSLITTLLVIDASLALGVGLIIGIVYIFAVGVSRGPLKELGQRQVVLNRDLIQALQEGLGAIREVLLNGHQNYYGSIYRQADRLLRRAGAEEIFLSSYPRLILEPVGMALIAVAGYLLVHEQGVGRALPLLGALALGAQRLLPIIQKVYEGWALSRASKESLANVLQLIRQPLPKENDNWRPNQFAFQRFLVMEGVRYQYGDNQPEVLQGLNLVIHKGERIGLVGTTGSGKSTAMDLIMGLLKPTAGRILIDGNDIHELDELNRLKAWRSTIAHVPQSIYLADSSFAENIALGLPRDDINLRRVRRAAEKAQIGRFIESTPQGYDSFVGERGIRLSGGQRQRIAIARALYKQAQVMVFDEATSALDTDTEEAVMNSIDGLSRELTIMIIAHRVSTLSRCDRVIRLEKGKIVGEVNQATASDVE